MTRWLYALVPCLLIGPHVIPAPDRAIDGPRLARGVPDDADAKDKIPSNAEMEKLAQKDPVAFLRACLKRYEHDVKTGYSATLQKQERINDRLEKKEVIDIHFRDKPHSVFFEWKEGERLAKRALFVEGENDGKVLVKPSGLGGFLVVSRDPRGADARKSGRYPLDEFGLKLAVVRMLSNWEKAKKDDALHVEYAGKVKVPEAGDRLCFKFRRTKYKQPEEEGITDLTCYIDVENWLLVGTTLKGAEGQLIGEYFFRDVRLDPDFAKDQFTREALSK